MNEVTDPALLAQLNGEIEQSGEVTDPAVLAQLNDAPVQNSPEKAAAALNFDVAQAIKNNASRAEIHEIVRSHGADPTKIKNLDAAIAYHSRHPEWTPPVVTGEAEQMAQPEVRQPQDRGVIDAVGNGIGDTLTFGALDEIGAGIGAAANTVKQQFGAGTDEDFSEYYGRVRDENRQSMADAQETNPGAYAVGQVAGGLAMPLGGEYSVARLAGVGAASGALHGAGSANGGIGDRVQNAVTEGAIGGIGSAGIGIAAKAISPMLSPAIEQLMRSNTRITPGQILRGNTQNAGPVKKALGTIAMELEDGARAFPVVGGQIDKARGRALQDFDQNIVAKAVEGRAQGYSPEMRLSMARETVESNSPAGRAVDALTDAYGTKGGTPSPRRIMDSVEDQIATAGRTSGPYYPQGFLEYANAGDEVLTNNGIADRAGKYIDNLLGPNAQSLLKLGTGAGVIGALGGHGGVAGIAAGAGLYTRPGQAIARSVLAGRQQALPKAVRKLGQYAAPREGQAIGDIYNEEEPYLGPTIYTGR